MKAHSGSFCSSQRGSARPGHKRHRKPVGFGLVSLGHWQDIVILKSVGSGDVGRGTEAWLCQLDNLGKLLKPSEHQFL